MKNCINQHKNMYYILRTSSPVSESWVFLLYAVLFAIAYIATRISPGRIILSFKSLFSYKERDSIFYIGQNDIRSDILMLIFSIVTIALNMMLGTYHGETFTFANVMILSALIVVFLVAKYFLGKLICFTFFDQGIFNIAYQHYERLLIATSIILFPITLISIYLIGVQPIIAYILYGIVIAFYCISLIIKIFMLFYTKKLAFLYIFLYLCSAEFLPLLGLILVAQKLA